MESVDPPASVGEPDSIFTADLRDVPLRQLGRDAQARRLVSRALESTEGPSRIRVAGFQSAI